MAWINVGVGMRALVVLVAAIFWTGPLHAQAVNPAPKAALKATAAKAKPKASGPKSVAPKGAAKTKSTAAPKSKQVVPRAGAPAATDIPAAPKVRDSYAAFTLAERIALQSDLVWTGDYNGLVNGEFSDRLVAAVKAFQTRNRSKPTGVLNPQERAALASSARPLRDEVGWRLTADPATGAHLGLPLKLATQVTAVRSGTRWSSQQGQLQIETFRVADTSLERVYERLRKEPVERRVAYNILRGDFFVISGTQGLKKFYVRAAIKDGEVRGMTVLYDQAMEGTMDPVVVAMSSAFNAFPAEGIAPDGTPVRRKIDYGTGLIVSSIGHIITDRQVVDGCRVIVVPGLGHAEQIADDKTGDLALLRLFGAHNLKPLGLIGPQPSGDAATVIGVADPLQQTGGDAVSAVAARLVAGAQFVEPTPALGFSGAVALDAAGRPLGMIVLKPSVVAGPSPTPQAVLVSRDRMVNFLEAHYVAPTSGPPGFESAKASVVRVICVRK